MSQPPPNPDSCCSVSTLCCAEDIPDNLTATLTAGNCPCLGGSTTISLNATGDWEWKGNGPFGGCGMDVDLRFYCFVVMNPPPGQVIGWRLDLAFSNDCAADAINVIPQSESCKPVLFVFNGPSSLVSCCSQTLAGNLVVTITA